MKTNKLIIGLLAVAATSLVSCEKFGADVETPSVSISVSPENPKVGEEVIKDSGPVVMLRIWD